MSRTPRVYGRPDPLRVRVGSPGMTDRHSAYIVTLAEDVREDDARPLILSLSMIRGVLSVEPVVADVQQHIAQQRADQRWRDRIVALLKRSDRP